MTALEPLLVGHRLWKSYRTAGVTVHALRDVNVSIHRGEFVAVSGASGAGKSTLLYLLGCLDRPTSGRLVFDGVDVASCSDADLSLMRATRIGFVFQTYHLINIYTVIENVALPLVYARQNGQGAQVRAAAALADVGLSHRGDHLPTELSGGEMQRVAVARAMINDPVLLLADEPTGNLDSRTGAEILDLFERVNRRGTTVVIVTHNALIAERAGRRLELVDGVVQEGR